MLKLTTTQKNILFVLKICILLCNVLDIVGDMLQGDWWMACISVVALPGVAMLFWYVLDFLRQPKII